MGGMACRDDSSPLADHRHVKKRVGGSVFRAENRGPVVKGGTYQLPRGVGSIPGGSPQGITILLRIDNMTPTSTNWGEQCPPMNKIVKELWL